MHVGEETRNQCRGYQQGDRNDAPRSHQLRHTPATEIRCALRRGLRKPAMQDDENKSQSKTAGPPIVGIRVSTLRDKDTRPAKFLLFFDYKGRLSGRSRVRGYQAGTGDVKLRTHSTVVSDR